MATSVISTIKVDCPEARSSEAPTLVNILSTIHILAESAGTKLPVCAIRTISAVCLIYVDLPAILGPVIIVTLFDELSRYVSLDINISLVIIFSTTGCRPFLISIIPLSLIFGFT